MNSKQCITCARKEKNAIKHGLLDFQCETYTQDEIEDRFNKGDDTCCCYFNLYVWRKQIEEKDIEIQKRKDIAKRNRERNLTFKPFKCLI